MINSRFITLIHSFNKKEMSGFGHYLHCFHAKMGRANQLYCYLQKLHPTFPQDKLSIEVLVRGAFNVDIGELDAKEKKNILNTLSDLYNWAKDFLIWQHLTSDPLKKDLVWMDILDDRNMGHEFQLKSAQVKKRLANEKTKDTWGHLDRLTFHHKVWIHHTTKRHTPLLEPLMGCMAELDQFYILSKMVYGTEMLNRKSLFKEVVDISVLDGFAAQSENYPNHPLMEAARMQYDLAKNKQEEGYWALKKFFLQKGSKLSITNKLVMLQYLINFTALMIRNGKNDFINETFLLYKLSLKPELQEKHDHISIHNFLNIVSAAIGANKLSWTAKFIQEYGPRLEANIRHAAVCYASAQLAFAKGQHNSPWFTELQTIKYADPLFAIRVKTLIIRNLYEAGHEISYLLLMNLNFRKFLNRNKKLTSGILISCLNFTDCFSELVLNRMPKNQLLEKFKTTNPLVLDFWLIEKANNLPDNQ